MLMETKQTIVLRTFVLPTTLQTNGTGAWTVEIQVGSKVFIGISSDKNGTLR